MHAIRGRMQLKFEFDCAQWCMLAVSHCHSAILKAWPAVRSRAMVHIYFEWEPRDVLIPRISLEVPFQNSPIPFVRKQFPVCPSFAMTINKSIGATFTKIGLCLCFHECWTHGQLYLAMSRVRDGATITNLVPRDASTKKPNCVLKNVVFPEAVY